MIYDTARICNRQYILFFTFPFAKSYDTLSAREVVRMRILCLGDSNTYGYDPRGYFGGRYGADDRWVDIIAKGTGFDMVNLGSNGRMIPHDFFNE